MVSPVSSTASTPNEPAIWRARFTPIGFRCRSEMWRIATSPSLPAMFEVMLAE